MVLVHTRFPETRTCDGTHEYLSSRSRRVTLQTGTRNTLERFVPDNSLPHSCLAMILRSSFQDDLPFFPDRLDSTRTLRCSPISSLTVSPRLPPSDSLSQSLPEVAESVEREAKVEANHHAITGAAGARGQLRPVLRKQQPPFAAVGHSPLRYCHGKTNNLRPQLRGKKRPLHRPPSSPPLFSKSPEGRPIGRLLASGESIARMAAIPLSEPIDRPRTYVLNSGRVSNLPTEHDIARNADHWITPSLQPAKIAVSNSLSIFTLSQRHRYRPIVSSTFSSSPLKPSFPL